MTRNVKQTRGGTMKEVTVWVDDEVYEFFKKFSEKINADLADVLGVELYNCYRKRNKE